MTIVATPNGGLCQASGGVCRSSFGHRPSLAPAIAVDHLGWALAGLGLGLAAVVLLLLVSLRLWRSGGAARLEDGESAAVVPRMPGSTTAWPPEPPALEDDRRELAARSSAGADVTLLWHPLTDELLVRVSAPWESGDFEIPVSHEQALDAYHHPYAYASRLSPAVAEPQREAEAVR
jgi:hypothetical protein